MMNCWMKHNYATLQDFFKNSDDGGDILCDPNFLLLITLSLLF